MPLEQPDYKLDDNTKSQVFNVTTDTAALIKQRVQNKMFNSSVTSQPKSFPEIIEDDDSEALIKQRVQNKMFNSSVTSQPKSFPEIIEDDDSEIQVLSHFSEYNSIHKKTREMIRKQSTIRNGESSKPIITLHDSTAYEKPVLASKSLSLKHIKKSKEKQNESDYHKMRNDKNESGLDSKNKKSAQKIASNRSSASKSSFPVTFSSRDSSPEIEIIEEKDFASTSSSSGSASRRRNSLAMTSISVNTSTVTSNDISQQDVQTPSKPINSAPAPPVTPNSSTSKTTASVYDRPSPWTPLRLREGSPRFASPHASNSKTTANSPRRGVKRILQDEDSDELRKSTRRSVATTSSSSKQNETSEDGIPKYLYLQAFKFLMTDVWNCQQNLPLFDTDDVAKFELFLGLSEAAKSLYLQLFKMKHQWRRVDNIKYKDIDPNLLPFIKELVVQSFLEGSDNLESLSSMLDLLKLPELKCLMQELKLPAKKNKVEMINSIQLHGRSQRSIVPGASTNLVKHITDRVRAIIGECVQINQDTADALHRVCILGSLPSCLSDETLQQLVYRVYRVQKGELIYPTVLLQRSCQIFMNRRGFLKFQQATKHLKDVQKLFVEKDWDGIIAVAQAAWTMFRELKNDAEIRVHDSQLPHFLRRFTAGNVLASVLKCGLEAMGRRKQYAVIVEVLGDLIGQEIYKVYHRGFWYERLSLTLQTHLKDINKAAGVVIEGMQDKHVHIINKVGLSFRASQLLTRNKSWKPVPHIKQALLSYSAPLIKEPKSITIRAKSRKGQGLRLDYVHDGADGEETVVSSVEEFAISHYKKQEGFTHGIHCEGSMIVGLFGILFWDIIYDHFVPDVFLNSFQDVPLDLFSREFYQHREAAVESRLREMNQWGDEDATIFIQGMWEQHCGKVSIVNWRLFSDVTQAQELLVCITPVIMTEICRRLCMEYVVARSGFPDLMVWSPAQKKCKFVEVKGPGDSLSNNQKIWIDNLMKMGSEVEVCYVQTVSTKYLQNIE